MFVDTLIQQNSHKSLEFSTTPAVFFCGTMPNNNSLVAEF